MPTGNYANHRYSQLKQITAQNVGKLKVAWTFSTGVLRGHEGGPLVIGDVMYVHGPFPNPVFALDLKNDAKILWKYEPKQDPDVIPVMCCDTVNRGLAYADGKIFLHQADTTLVALDAKDGKVVWQAKNGDPKKGETGRSDRKSTRLNSRHSQNPYAVFCLRKNAYKYIPLYRRQQWAGNRRVQRAGDETDVIAPDSHADG